MQARYSSLSPTRSPWFYLAGPLLFLLLFSCRTVLAQAPNWSLLVGDNYTTPANHQSTINATAVDGSGNVLVVGYFNDQVSFGSITLTSRGDSDFFVAKYLTATNTWAWATGGGGLRSDGATSVAVSGNTVYVLGGFTNNTLNYGAVLLGSTSSTPGTVLYGATNDPNLNSDMMLLAYTDNGSSASLKWSQVAGGTEQEGGGQLAVSGTSIYALSTFVNDRANSKRVFFGSTGTPTQGTLPQAGASTTVSRDVVLAKFTDNGASASYVWSQIAGGSGQDANGGIDVSSNNIYITGSFENNRTNSSQVVFGGTGTTAGTVPQYGATVSTNSDLVLAKYVDQGATAAIVWTQVGGGTSGDYGYDVAVSGTSVYVTGSIINTFTNSSQVVFGGAGTTAGTVAQYGASYNGSSDIVLAKYTDNGTSATFGWSQVAGGESGDAATRVIARGNRVYVGGVFSNTSANDYKVVFGGSGTTLGTVTVVGVSPTSSFIGDAFVAGYLDQGSSARLDWTRVGGGVYNDAAFYMTLSNTKLYVAGLTVPASTFGNLTLPTPVGYSIYFLAALDLTGTLAAATPVTGKPTATLYPNPSAHTAALTGATAGALVQVYNTLGSLVLTAQADGTGAVALVLPASLPGGLYLVRSGTGPALRLTVE